MILMNDLISLNQAVKKVNPVTRKHLILLTYKILEEKPPLPNYKRIHRCIKRLQDMLESKYSYTLGYEFKDGGKSSIYEVWDNNLQKDIERYDALEKIVDNADVHLSDELRGYYSHKLQVSSRPKGMFLLKTNVKYNLKNVFGNLDELRENVRNACHL